MTNTLSDQIAKAKEALDNLDDYARMDVGVDAMGPRGVLEKFIASVEELLAANTQAPASPKPVDCDLRLNAYYYCFDQTGVPEIDRILSAVACAGKSYHGTESWNDPAELPLGHEGATPIDWIQNAANDAAKRPVAQQASKPDAAQSDQARDAELIRACREFFIEKATAYGEVSFADYCKNWYSVEVIRAAIEGSKQ